MWLESSVRSALAMAKSKNHTNDNQNRKAHRNGIKKAKQYKKMSMKGMCPKFLRSPRGGRTGGRVPLPLVLAYRLHV